MAFNIGKFNPLKALGFGAASGFKNLGKFLSGTPDQMHQLSNLRPEQEGLFEQLVNAGKGAGAGGAFGQSADYYRGLLGDDSQDFNAFSAPQMRQFREDILPQLSEQFAGMGSGGLRSSGFQNAQNQAGVDLAERLGAIRANLRQSGAQGLQNIGQLGLNPTSQYVNQPGTPGFIQSFAPAIGQGIGSAVGGPIGGAIGGGIGNWFGSSNRTGTTMPNWNNQRASPNLSGSAGSYGGR